MRITVLMEDTEGRSGVIAEHGLSLFIETAGHVIISDTGASEKTLLNAEVLGCSLAKADTVVISHGHYDHTGGLLSLCRENKNAEIYIHKKALGDYYHGERYIGADKRISSLPKLHFTDGEMKIGDGVFVFSGFSKERLYPSGNSELSEKIGTLTVPDEFLHEQCLVIEENGKRVLISGCAHNGILNILDRYREIFRSFPDFVVSGFHMIKSTPYTSKDISEIEYTANELLSCGCDFYTGHCTGDEAFSIMKKIMKDKLHRIRSGDSVIL